MTVVSDESWRGTNEGPIRSSSIFKGELYDAARAMPGWDRPEFPDAAWNPVAVQESGSADMVWQCNQPINMVREVKPMAVTEPKPGMFIFDFGQNMVGWCRVKVKSPVGTTVTLRHAEMLRSDGTLFTANLGPAVQTDRYILASDDEAVLEPRFTYHGFRYVEVTGLSEALSLDFLTGRMFHSHAPDTGSFECSSPLLNKIMEIIVWTQKANMMSIPTDCPQRAERAGWMGDIQAFATAFFAHSTEIVAKMARVLGLHEEAAYHDQLFGKIKAAFQKAFVYEVGRIHGDTQAGYALALRFNLVPDTLRPQVARRMIEALQRFEGRFSTGIQTTHRLMLELTRNNYHSEACRLVQSRTFPSWGYMIDQGATTIWERWDGFVAGQGFNKSGMNSFNHWSFGAAGEWIWRHLVGIHPDETAPGFEHFLIRPRPSHGLTWAKGNYDSIRGRIASHWKIEDGQFHLEVTVPANTEATVFVPTSNASQVTENGMPVSAAKGINYLGTEGDASIYRVA